MMVRSCRVTCWWCVFVVMYSWLCSSCSGGDVPVVVCMYCCARAALVCLWSVFVFVVYTRGGFVFVFVVCDCGAIVVWMYNCTRGVGERP